MKKLWLLTILVFLQVSLNIFKTQAQVNVDRVISFAAQGITLKQAFQQLEKLGGLSVNYNNTKLNDQRIVNVAKGERSIKETLNALLNGTAFTFRRANGNNILIIDKPANNGKITGRVVDESGAPLPGAVIRITSLGLSRQTEEDGSYTLNVVPGSYTLEISFISYDKFVAQNVIVKANETRVINASLEPSNNALSEVVVTALGIKREEKSLGYSTTTIDSTQLTDAISSNWTDALSGKVAGLNLVRNGGPAGSNKIILRGENNLTGDNEALIVIDGVVASSSSRRTAATGGGVYGTSGDIMPADFGSGLNDLNPDDIENVTVLKGPGASALYGQRGANGAIIITTKSGNEK